MKKEILVSIILMVTFLILIGGGSAVGQEKVKFYQMTFQSENVSGKLSINGFVLTELDGKPGNGSYVLNPWLIGENELKAEVNKTVASKPTELAFGVSVMQQGDIVATTDKGKLFSMELKNKDFKGSGMTTAAKKFKSGLDFRSHLSETGKAKESDILSYARKFHELFAKKDADGILRETEAKISDYSKAFGGSDMKEEMRSYLTGELFKAKLNRLNPSALRAVAEGPSKNIWHVFNGRDELVVARTPDGSTLEMPVYIGLIDGKLKVVR